MKTKDLPRSPIHVSYFHTPSTLNIQSIYKPHTKNMFPA